MTNYNDGKWHGWNGGECPVHPESIVEYVWSSCGQTGCDQAKAGYTENGVRPAWSGSVKAFRVINEHLEPRVLRLIKFDAGVWQEVNEGVQNSILFREVIE